MCVCVCVCARVCGTTREHYKPNNKFKLRIVDRSERGDSSQIRFMRLRSVNSNLLKLMGLSRGRHAA